ncbi:MAG: hypothetical protein Q9191_002868 [Dirinaria sp. TL-2023a]
MSSPQVQAILQPHLDRLLSKRTHPKTLCPSEVARALSPEELKAAEASEWRSLMPTIREMLWELRSREEVEILQRGELISEGTRLEDLKGPIRARRCV